MALVPNTGIPLDATYDPDASFAFNETRSAGLLPPAGPMESAPVRQQSAPSTVGISQGGRWWVNGKQFDTDDHQSAVESQAALDGPDRPMPAGYRAVSPDEYKGYLKQIIDPTLGRLAKKNFGIGIDNLQLLGGYGMQLAGAEKAGKAVVEQQVEDLRYNEPYQRTFTEDVASDPIGWFVGTLAQQGPNIIESALAAVAGAGVGALAGGGANPFTAIGGAMMALGGKQGVKQAILDIAKRKAAGEALEAGEMKLLREAASGAAAFNMKGAAKEVLKRGSLQARIGGATAATYGSNYAYGAADTYGEQLDSGTPDRPAALALAVPYALLESLPELVGFGYFAKGTKVPFRGKGNALKRGKNFVGAVALGGVGEGLTEAGQETLLLTQNEEVDITSREGINRLVNSFFAGAAVGGTMSGGASVLRKGRKPVDTTEENADLLGIASDGEQKQITYQQPAIEGVEQQQLPYDPLPPEQLAAPEEQLLLEQSDTPTPFDPSTLAIPSEVDLTPAPTDVAQQNIPPIQMPFDPSTLAPPILAPDLTATGRIAQQQALDAQRQLTPEQLRMQEANFFNPIPSTPLDQRELNLQGGVADQVPSSDFPAFDAPMSTPFPTTPTFVGEPTINVPVKGRLQAVTVRKALEASDSRIGALQALRNCLAKNA